MSKQLDLCLGILFLILLANVGNTLSGQTSNTTEIFIQHARLASRTNSKAMPALHRAYYVELGRSYLLNYNKDIKRPSSYPHVTGDGLRQMADHLYDETKKLNIASLKYGESVFVKGDLLNDFLEKMHPLIKKQYVIIVHNSDCSAPRKYLKYVESETVLAWFVQNADISHTKIHPVPIGIANAHWEHGTPSHFAHQLPFSPKLLSSARDILLYIGALGATSPSRKQINELFPWAVIIGRRSHPQYLQDLSRSKFVLSPPGNGADCHRTWEAILMGAVPIVVRHDAFTSLYSNLPVLIVDNISSITKQQILSYKLPHRLNFDALWARTYYEKLQTFKDYYRPYRNVENKAAVSCSVVLVHLGDEYNSYLHNNIAQLRNIMGTNCNIYLYATKPQLFLYVADTFGVHLLSNESVHPSQYIRQFHLESRLDKSSLLGFWRHSSERILIVHSVIKQLHLKNVFHIESDNLVYYDLSKLIPCFHIARYKVGVPCDSSMRCIAGLVYFSDEEGAEIVARVFVSSKVNNDMQAFALARRLHPDIVQILPLVPKSYGENYSKNGEFFPCIFDAAALGQYIAGIDPMHEQGNSTGFINKAAAYQVNKFKISWQKGLPYADGMRICNLHIHSKELHRWMTRELS